jgi:hypothetical protein
MFNCTPLFLVFNVGDSGEGRLLCIPRVSQFQNEVRKLWNLWAPVNIVTCIPIARQRHGKYIPATRTGDSGASIDR